MSSQITGARRKLSDLQEPDPLIVVLGRGGFCPKDRRQAEGLVQLYHEMEVGYCRLLTITTDNLLATNEYRTGRRRALDFLVRCGTKRSEGSRHCRVHGPRSRSDDSSCHPLEPGLVVFKIYNGYWFFGRPTVEELRQDLRAVLRKYRPDWDITTPELKAEWERGDHARFYPYGKTYGQVFREQE